MRYSVLARMFKPSRLVFIGVSAYLTMLSTPYGRNSIIIPGTLFNPRDFVTFQALISSHSKDFKASVRILGISAIEAHGNAADSNIPGLLPFVSMALVVLISSLIYIDFQQAAIIGFALGAGTVGIIIERVWRKFSL